MGRRRAAVVAGTLGLLLAACGSSGAGGGPGPSSSSAVTEPTTGVVPPPAGEVSWHPATGSLPWQWELDHEPDLTDPADAGIDDRTPTGLAAARPVVYDVDGFDTTAADVRAIHGIGARAICYVEIGGSESYRPDAGRFPRADLGRGVDGYPSEHYLDIRAPAVVGVIESRIRMCAAKGFDAVEPDLDDTYTDTTGFPLTEADDVAYDRALAAFAARLGLTWGLKNGADGGSPTTFVAALLPYIEFAVVEEPFHLHTLAAFRPLLRAGKAVFAAEYTDDTSASEFAADCRLPVAGDVNVTLFDVALDGRVRVPCR